MHARRRTALTAFRRSDTAATLRSLASSYGPGSRKGLGASGPAAAAVAAEAFAPPPPPLLLSPRPTKLPRSAAILHTATAAPGLQK